MMTATVSQYTDEASALPTGTFDELLGLLEKRLQERTPDHGERLRMATDKAIAAGRATMFDYSDDELVRIHPELPFLYAAAAE
jgi:hypothetical protein